jgi:tetratricopeptide (TPR) repeat protein
VCGSTSLARQELASNAGADFEPLDVLNHLSSLVDKSLVVVDEHDGARRYRLLETIRQYATELVASCGEVNVIGQRHAEHYVALAEHAEPRLRGADQLSWFQRLETEHDNLRVALGRLVEHDCVDLALRLGAALWWFWNVGCHFREGRRWLDRILAMDSAPSAVRGRALIGAGYLTLALDEPRRAMALHEEALQVLETHGDARDIAMAHRSLGRAALRLRDFRRACAALEEALAMLRELDDAWGVAACLHNLGNVAMIQAEEGRGAVQRSPPAETAAWRYGGDCFVTERPRACGRAFR